VFVDVWLFASVCVGGCVCACMYVWVCLHAWVCECVVQPLLTGAASAGTLRGVVQHARNEMPSGLAMAERAHHNNIGIVWMQGRRFGCKGVCLDVRRSDASACVWMQGRMQWHMLDVRHWACVWMQGRMWHMLDVRRSDARASVCCASTLWQAIAVRSESVKVVAHGQRQKLLNTVHIMGHRQNRGRDSHVLFCVAQC
jgi:hypothetical protein